MSNKKCEQCQYFTEKLYSKKDSRCTHNTAILGKDEKGTVVSFMLVSEARASLADEKKHGIAPWGYIPCGPKGIYFKERGR